MAGATVRFDDREVRQALRRLAGADLDSALRDAGEYLLIATRERFAREQAPDGAPWEPLAESTLRRKMLGGVKRGKGRRRLTTTAGGHTKAGAVRALAGAKILVESGDLRDLMRYQVAGGALRVGADRIYAATQQFGDPSRHIPARPFLGLSAADRREILDILAEHLRGAMGQR